MKQRTKNILWSLGIGAIIAIGSTYSLNNLFDQGEGFKLLFVLSVEFIIISLSLGVIIKTIFFD